MKEAFTLSLDAFIRSIGVSGGAPNAFFLGAGASISSGVPHAGQCVWEWKRQIFLTNNPGLEQQFSELSLPNTKQQIQHWLESHGYPKADDPKVDEYCLYAEACFPIAEHRRRFFQSISRECKPSVGYRLMCRLALSGLCEYVWTTNFDGLLAKAAANTPPLVVIEVGLDSVHRTMRQPARNELMSVSLHGDYRYDPLKNIPAELQQQDKTLRESLITRLIHTNLIVNGYSGRDASVMEALRAAYSQKGTGELYWCGRGERVPPVVEELIRVARNAGRTAYYVPTDSFDDLIVRLASHCLRGESHEEARRIITSNAHESNVLRSPFSIGRFPTSGVIKSNAYPLTCPSDVLRFSAAMPAQRIWQWVREKSAGHPVIAAPFRDKVIALGTEDGVKDAFGASLKGPIERSPVDQSELSIEDGVIVELFRTALVRLIGSAANLQTDQKRIIWEQRPYRTYPLKGRSFNVHRAATLALRNMAGNAHLILKPTLFVSDAAGKPATKEDTKAIRTALLGYQHNDKYNEEIRRWQEYIFGNRQELTLAFPPNSGSTFRFIVKRAPQLAKIGNPQHSNGIFLLPKIESQLTQSGFELPEPPLLFASQSAGAKPVRDEHPMRGLVNNRPYDFALTRVALADRVKVGVVCPKEQAVPFHAFLSAIIQSHPEPRGGLEYTLHYPGFQTAFGLPIHLPAQPFSPGWATCPEPKSGADDYATAIDVAQQIVAQIDALQASESPNVVAIFIPNRWNLYRTPQRGDIRFNLHDYLKAQCVRRGIATQLIEENTLSDEKCRVYWWLSLALYAKSKRTPWVLDCLQEKTAYAGLGISIDQNAATGEHVILGCSHLYSPKGEGLRYRLSKVEKPIIRRKNAYLSEDDARRLGESICQLYFEATYQLPERVVIHKRTPFCREEMEGLRQGLHGVRHVDLIEITVEPQLRYIASVIDGNGGLKQDSFPVRRGTVVQIDEFTALLWNHGVTTAVDARKKYYQGKRRIPSPLAIRRHAGNASLECIAQEILGLSKMNWNSFDMYAKIPATITSSNEIARIGSMLERFSESSYDFRLFM